MQSFTNKTVLTKKSQITLPKKIREFLGVKPGERVAFIIENNAVQIIPLKSKLEENFGKVKPIVKSVPNGHPFRFKLDAHYEINWTPFVF
jgi:AbrB family looped-hinge helix DNA binding protein